MLDIEPDEEVLAAHEALVSRGMIEPLANDAAEAHDWLAWELASLIEGHFHRIVSARALSRAERQVWEYRVTGRAGLRDPRREQMRRVYWLVQRGGERAGTIALDTIRLGRPAYSGGSRPLIPAQADHPFRSNPTTDSGHSDHPFRACRPGIPADVDHPARGERRWIT